MEIPDDAFDSILEQMRQIQNRFECIASRVGEVEAEACPANFTKQPKGPKK